MLGLIFTLDYEIHGNGQGCPMELMVDPTNRLMRLLESHGARLTIMADVAEIMRFADYRAATGRDDYHHEAIVHQLQDAVRRGHDVQLHLHSSYFNATHQSGRWRQDWTEYDFARLPYERMHWMVGTAKRWLERTLRVADAGYRCLAFRAANWSVAPAQRLSAALAAHDIVIDTSVFRDGRRDGLVTFDYGHAYSALAPWRASADDLCVRDESGPLWEVPIYAERRWLGAFLSPGRLVRAAQSRRHRLEGGPARPDRAHRRTGGRLSRLLGRHAWKADFNQCTGRQLVRALERADQAHGGADLPFVLIGHSKLFTPRNARSLAPLLAHAADRNERFHFDTLSGLAPRLVEASR
jgi:hypothetical protein